jgi:cytosine/adenosine deaminase-related metal-dependent hydrolase
MKRFSAQYIFTNTGPSLKRGIICTNDEGIILSVEDTGGLPVERESVEFYNGIIIPGFVNSHCHLELSHLRGVTGKGRGLGNFIEQVRSRRDSASDDIISHIQNADDEMFREGIVLCADICNTGLSFGTKAVSRIKYINLLEVFGVDPASAGKRISEVMKLSEASADLNIPWYIVPHAVYSTSLPLLRLIRDLGTNNKVTSIHFMESEGEKEFSDTVMNEITSSGNLILVHNTYADRETVEQANRRCSTFWCLCPGSNLFIENRLPRVYMLNEAGCELVTGTDSLASAAKLSILGELKILQENFPLLSLGEIIRWSTLNGAKALGESDQFGSIEAGRKPGLLLLSDIDLINLRLLPQSTVKRLI